MKDWKKTLVEQGKTIREAIRILDESSLQIVLVVDEFDYLLGTVTDGDIRRGILKGLSLEESVVKVMITKPTVSGLEKSEESLLALMREKELRHVPIVDEKGKVVGLRNLFEYVQKQPKNNWVVIMAGGLGKRLGIMTKDCPKPLLKVGNKPLLETIIKNFKEYGFHKFYFSVNFMAEKIQEYFGDGSTWNVEIRYLKESIPLGTAGALSLLPEIPDDPLIVMNGDILTKVNFEKLLDFHSKHQASATMCVREYDFQVPYGVVKTENQRIIGIDEKPVQRFFINGGLYVLESRLLQYIPPDTFFNMTELFDKVIAQHLETLVFPIREYWMDIGQVDDFHRANGEYSENFE